MSALLLVDAAGLVIAWVGGAALLAYAAARFAQRVVDRHLPRRPLLTRAALGVDIGRDGAPTEPPTQLLAVTSERVSDVDAAILYARQRAAFVIWPAAMADGDLDEAAELAAADWDRRHPTLAAHIRAHAAHPSFVDDTEQTR